MGMIKHSIEVRVKGDYLRPGRLIKTIRRKPWLEAIGNFNPMFCRYEGKVVRVNSLEGDISDPFRREESYLKTLYIEVEEEIKP
jgi:hypothetical protein